MGKRRGEYLGYLVNGGKNLDKTEFSQLNKGVSVLDWPSFFTPTNREQSEERVTVFNEQSTSKQADNELESVPYVSESETPGHLNVEIPDYWENERLYEGTLHSKRHKSLNKDHIFFIL